MANQLNDGYICYTDETPGSPVALKPLTGGHPYDAHGTPTVKFSETIKGQPICLRIEGRPDLAALVEEQRAAWAARKAANEARWAQEKAAQAAIDAPLLAAMGAHVEELVTQIPAGAVRVTVTKVGDADGNPILRYTAEGTEIRWDQAVVVGRAAAIRPGAMGAFASEIVAYIVPDALAAIRGEQTAAAAAAAASREERRRNLNETPVPPAAVAAYKRYRGNADRAWEESDEAAWAMIGRWSDHIETQGLAHGRCTVPVEEIIDA